MSALKLFSVHVTRPSGLNSLDDGYLFIGWRGMSESGEKSGQYFKVPADNFIEFAAGMNKAVAQLIAGQSNESSNA